MNKGLTHATCSAFGDLGLEETSRFDDDHPNPSRTFFKRPMTHIIRKIADNLHSNGSQADLISMQSLCRTSNLLS